MEIFFQFFSGVIQLDDSKAEHNLSSEESEILDDDTESTQVKERSLKDNSFKDLNLNQDLPSSVPLRQVEKHISTDDPGEFIKVPQPTVGHASDEWMKAKRLIKVAGMFQKRLNKGVRSLSDPQIEIPIEFVSEAQRYVKLLVDILY